MQGAVLVVHYFSYPFIRNVAHFIHETLGDSFERGAALSIREAVDEAEFEENTAVFIIGETFPPFQRQDGCRYFYLNFSVVSVLGRPWETGLAARRAIRHKRKMLAGRLGSVDAVLDYYPPQTRVLQRQLGLLVLGFDVATVAPAKSISMRERPYDVCFVGSLNARRRAVCDVIRDRDLSMSPSKDIVIEDAAAQSRVCLNVHSVRSHHFETPRFLAAFAAGTPMVTEPSFGAGGIVDLSHAVEDRCDALPDAVERLLSEDDRLEEMGQNARHWYLATYLPRARKNWRETCERLRHLEFDGRAVA